MRGATAKDTDTATDKQISIHAPREGSDQVLRFMRCMYLDFNPRSP